MSKESAHAIECACGQRIAFPEYHISHCQGEREDVKERRLARIEAGINALTAKVMDKVIHGDRLEAAAKNEEKISKQQRTRKQMSKKNTTRQANSTKKGKRK